MKIGSFRMDAELETGGVWCEAGAGLRLLVARMRNAKYRDCLRELCKPHLRGMRRGNVDTEVLGEASRRAAARHVLLGWENLQEDDGSEIVYTPEKAYELMTEYSDFSDMVMEFATDAELYRKENRDDAEKNS